MSSPSFIMPHNLIPSSKYHEIRAQNEGNAKLSNRDVYEYRSSKLSPMYSSATFKSHPPIYTEKVTYNPKVVNPNSAIPNYSPPGGSGRKVSCMNSFPCLNGQTRGCNEMNNGTTNGTYNGVIFKHPSVSGYTTGYNAAPTNKRFVKKVSKVPCLFNTKPAFRQDSCEKGYSDVSGVPIHFDSPVHGSKGYVQLSRHDEMAVYNMNEKKKNKDLEVMGKLNHVEPFKKRVSKEKLPEPIIKNKINELIKEKDEQIKELEIEIQNEKRKSEMVRPHGAENPREYANVENRNLKEKLLDQKIKYEETLKHLKRVELDRRSLKSSLNVRDKVLTKLENEIGSVDNENDFLLRLKENTSLSDVHNLFKFLQGRDKEAEEERYHNSARTNNEKGKGLNKDKERNKRVDSYARSDTYRVDETGQGKHKEDEFSWYKSKSTCDDSLLPLEDDASEENRNSYKKGKKVSTFSQPSFDNNDMYTLKSTIVELEKEVYELKEENKSVNFKYENTFQALSELRKDTLEYMESIVSRDMRIAYMESMLQKSEKDLGKLKELLKKQQVLYREKVDKCTSEISILEKQSSHLQSMIQEKDSEIVLLKNEIIRNEMLVRQYEERNKELQNELRLMCNNLENVIDASNKKDLFMVELEKQIRENEVHRQNAYLKEVAKNRKVQANMKFKEIMYDKSAKHQVDELQSLKKELYLNKIQMQKARDAFEVLKKVPKAGSLRRSKQNVSQDNDSSTVHNFTMDKNDQDGGNTTFEAKVSSETAPAYKAKHSVVKKKKRAPKARTSGSLSASLSTSLSASIQDKEQEKAQERAQQSAQETIQASVQAMA
ncbi:hypothetical protein C922_00564 [Plasmodium inui San Antonio 1]|uniref:Uncharacterized protein n=1 Tax=Plasmodium inui San Antonio 1 TaxID=1237626 RepID=W7ATW4_9APIC|nr:hypothetical protein C922_00564 [Plasmodium inui San Antonio 1]EUD68876.1 hypothetical protein C922_00564 [Plasmodium inui San Antonio 1]